MMTLVTMGEWMVMLTPVLLGAVWGLDTYKNGGFLREKTLRILSATALLVFLIGVGMYAPIGVPSMDLPVGSYFGFMVIVGICGFIVCAVIWGKFFQLLGGLAWRRELRK